MFFWEGFCFVFFDEVSGFLGGLVFFWVRLGLRGSQGFLRVSAGSPPRGLCGFPRESFRFFGEFFGWFRGGREGSHGFLVVFPRVFSVFQCSRFRVQGSRSGSGSGMVRSFVCLIVVVGSVGW